MTEGRREERAVPVGLEQVLLLAGVDPRFAEALRTEPEATLAASGVALSATERVILETVSDAQREQMAVQLAATVAAPARRAFLAQASAVVATLGIGPGLAGGCDEKKPGGGPVTPEKGGGENRAAMAAMARERQRTLKRSHRVIAPTGVRPGPWPHTTVSEPRVKGPLDPKIVWQKLKAYARSAERCWFRNGPHAPGGTIRLALTVDGAGRVKRATLGTEARKTNPIESCILAAARQWRFPPSKPRPTQILVSLKFESRY